MEVFRFLCLLIATCSLRIAAFEYETRTFETLLDHFSFVDGKTFSMRYLINETFALNEKSPILFYAGNEAAIELFAKHTGFIWRAAEELQAIVVFAEHRYYGSSIPQGSSSFEHLSIEQALADFADLLMKINPDNLRPVIAFGGSYGGTLAAYFRMKYPHLVTGALASSAPVMEFPGLVPCDIYFRIITSVFKVSLDKKADGSRNTACADNLKRFWTVLQ
jgi:lysosomal Pro-X carboxypeptidase